MTNQLRDSLVFDYGANLMAREEFWVFGMDYLEQAAEGMVALELSLSKVPLPDENTAEEVIRQCQLRGGMPTVESDVCKVMARRALSENMLGDSLVWAIRSQNNIFVTSIADIFLNVSRVLNFFSASATMVLFFRLSAKPGRCPVRIFWKILERKCLFRQDLCS